MCVCERACVCLCVYLLGVRWSVNVKFSVAAVSPQKKRSGIKDQKKKKPLIDNEASRLSPACLLLQHKKIKGTSLGWWTPCTPYLDPLCRCRLHVACSQHAETSTKLAHADWLDRGGVGVMGGKTLSLCCTTRPQGQVSLAAS